MNIAQASRRPPTRSALLAQLPQRLGELGRRGEHLARNGWDINALWLLASDAETLADTSARLGDEASARRLVELAECLWPLIDVPALPDQTTSARIGETLATLAGAQTTEAALEIPGGEATLFGYAANDDNGFPLLLRPPPQYWRRFPARTAPVATPAAVPADEAPSRVEPVAKVAAPGPTPAPVVEPAITPVAAIASPPAPATRESDDETISQAALHLGDGSPLAGELEARLRAQGHALRAVADLATLKDLLGRTTPGLVVVHARNLDAIDELGALVQAARARGSRRLAWLTIAPPADLAARLRVMRAGCDALMADSASAGDVSARIEELGESAAADPYRVMIVEDDRSQAMFAESILRKNGMQTLIVAEAVAVLDQLDAFRPDLILMDLHMPVCDGIELTALIREREAFMSTPIVFLSGDNDTDRHFAALSAGGDDFLSKPIAPKHLVAAVGSRVRRARVLERRRGPAARDPFRATAADDKATRVAAVPAAPRQAPTAAAEPAVPERVNDEVVVAAIRQALDSGSFRIVFQPIVSLRGDENERFQALLRLPTVDGRTWAAGELVPAAERAGLIADIDRWVLGECIRTLGERLRLGHAVRLFVSQSLASARETDRAEWLRRQLDQHRVPASHLVLELRADEAFSALSQTVAFALAMKQLGAGTAVSGFDGGARGCEMLSHLPIDYVKLGARFTRAGDEALRKELRDLVKLAHAGGRRVIAPRVEDARATAALWSDGVDLIQGNFVRQADRDLSYDFQAATM